MHRVVILTLAEGCSAPRTPVLACRDALRAAGAEVDLVTADSDAEIDAALRHGATGPASTGSDPGGHRFVVAAATDGQVRAVIRRLVRGGTPSPGKRPPDLPPDRTVPDLPPIGILPMGGGLVGRLGVPSSPEMVAAAVLAGRTRRFDLLRNDGGSLTLDGALLGGTDKNGRAMGFRAAINVDDAVLTDGRESLMATVVANADGYATFDGLPLVVGPSPADGILNVAVALPIRRRNGVVEMEVRRAHGRAVSITPRVDEVPYLDDGVSGTLTRKRTWWVERAAWAVYAIE